MCCNNITELSLRENKMDYLGVVAPGHYDIHFYNSVLPVCVVAQLILEANIH